MNPFLSNSVAESVVAVIEFIWTYASNFYILFLQINCLKERYPRKAYKSMLQLMQV